MPMQAQQKNLSVPVAHPAASTKNLCSYCVVRYSCELEAGLLLF